MKAQVLLPKIFNFPFTYNSKTEGKIGNLVEVPFGSKKEIGVIWKSNFTDPKNIIIKDGDKEYTVFNLSVVKDKKPSVFCLEFSLVIPILSNSRVISRENVTGGARLTLRCASANSCKNTRAIAVSVGSNFLIILNDTSGPLIYVWDVCWYELFQLIQIITE